ncbi:MAG: DUF4163 domain-containing protein [Bdellovibrionales bacterium]|nr:DUF4163 domain-containing protein [Bdellovibrionales bacterium]
MKHFLSLLCALVVAASASADQFKTVTEEFSQPKSQAEISYPVFFENSVPAFQKINADIVTHLKESSCGPVFEGEEEWREYSYNVTTRVVGLNQKYIGLEMTYDIDCGGAHPNFGFYNRTYNSQTGEVVDMGTEIPLQDFENEDWQAQEQYRKELAAIMYNNLGQLTDKDWEPSCYEGMNKQETIEQIEQFWPYVSGLAKDKKVIIRLSPPHVATPCGFAVRVSYSEVQKYLAPNSILHTWLK